MKFKMVLVATLASIMAGSFVVYSRVRAGEATDNTQAQTLEYRCPQNIKVGPVSMEGNWRPGPSLFVQFNVVEVSTDSATKQQQVVCWYGKDLSAAYLVSQPVPAGYDCERASTSAPTVTCEKKTPQDRRRRGE